MTTEAAVLKLKLVRQEQGEESLSSCCQPPPLSHLQQILLQLIFPLATEMGILPPVLAGFRKGGANLGSLHIGKANLTYKAL